MRMRALPRALMLVLACGSGAFGCQIVAGLSVLQITGGSGGSGGSGGAGGQGGEGGSGGSGGSGGKPTKVLGNSCSSDDECGSTHCTDGVCCGVLDCFNECLSCAASSDGTCKPKTNAPCKSSIDDACTDPDTCDDQGICQPHHAPTGTSCGETFATSCSAPDTCDGSGSCLPNHLPSTTACGSATDNACTDPDTCDGQGVCQPNNAALGTVCGGTCAQDMAVPAGTCSSTGMCSSQTATSCPTNYGCAADGKVCATTCTASSGCSATGVCVSPMGGTNMCLGCGIMPPSPNCPGMGSGCETCDVSTCVKTCDTPQNECNGPMGLDASQGPARIVCGAQCNDTTITCFGPFPCEVVCNDSGGCHNLTLVCGTDGVCKLSCTGTGCPAPIAMKCGENECKASCSGPSSVVNQTCNGSCGCSKPGCQ